MLNIEYITRVFISYEMTTSVRFCLSYDRLKWDFIAFKMIIFTKKTHCYYYTKCAKVLLHVWPYDFSDITLSTEEQRRHMINPLVL